ncbi:MAG: polysaccharide biosynthesis tyrosine autokinase [Planctomycetaceae bacterium]|nr:polysaccharide biosynthesis tyrosine autokinase [Planctomycetaceae bacterium]
MPPIQMRDRYPLARPQADVRHRPAGPGPAATGSGLTGRDFTRMLRKRKWWIIMSVAILGAGAFTTTLLWRQFAPQYSVKADLYVNPIRQQQGNSFVQNQGEFTADTAGTNRQQHARMICTPEFLRAACDSADVRRTRWFKRNEASAVDLLVDRLSTNLYLDENRMGVVFTSVARTDQDRGDLAEMLRAVVEEYVRTIKARASKDVTDSIVALRAQKTAQEEQLTDLRRRIGMLNYGEMGTIASLIQTKAAKLDTINQVKVQLGMDLQAAQGRLKDLDDRKAAGTLAESAEIAVLVEDDPQIRQLRDRQSMADARLASLQSNYGPKDHRVLQAQADITILADQLVHQRSAMLDVKYLSVRPRYKADVDRIVAQQLSLAAQEQPVNAEIQGLQKNLKELQDLKTQEAIKQGYVQKLDEQLLVLTMREKELTPVWVSLLPTPPAVNEIAKPKWSIMMAGGIIGGLLLGLLMAVALEFLDSTVKGPRDLTRRLDLPVLGIIPHVDDLDESFSEVAMAFAEHPDSMVCEAHRQIRTTLQFSSPANQQRSILISSAMPGEGRTTLTMNLAHAIARSGRRVLVVDANFRQPALQRLVPACPAQGLSNALVGQIDWRTAVAELEPNFDVLAAGPLPPNPAELLGSEQMLSILTEMMEAYDQVLLDGAPCVVVTDPVALSTLVDGVIIVVRAGSSTSGLVQRARDLFTRVGAHLFGVVLNAVRAEAGGYLRRNYDTFYEYRSQTALPSLPPSKAAAAVLSGAGADPPGESQ